MADWRHHAAADNVPPRPPRPHAALPTVRVIRPRWMVPPTRLLAAPRVVGVLTALVLVVHAWARSRSVGRRYWAAAWQCPLAHVRVPLHSQSFAHTPSPPPFHASFQW
jgi:hypothetical protein